MHRFGAHMLHLKMSQVQPSDPMCTMIPWESCHKCLAQGACLMHICSAHMLHLDMSQVLTVCSQEPFLRQSCRMQCSDAVPGDVPGADSVLPGAIPQAIMQNAVLRWSTWRCPRCKQYDPRRHASGSHAECSPQMLHLKMSQVQTM